MYGTAQTHEVNNRFKPLCVWHTDQRTSGNPYSKSRGNFPPHDEWPMCGTMEEERLLCMQALRPSSIWAYLQHDRNFKMNLQVYSKRIQMLFFFSRRESNFSVFSALCNVHSARLPKLGSLAKDHLYGGSSKVPGRSSVLQHLKFALGVCGRIVLPPHHRFSLRLQFFRFRSLVKSPFSEGIKD